MKALNLDKEETGQLYVLLSLFNQTGELVKLDYSDNGPARRVAGKVADFLCAHYGDSTITIGEE